MPAIIKPSRGVIGRDPDRRDTRVGEYDPDEGEVSIAWRGRNRAGEYQLTAAVKILDLCIFRLGIASSVWLVNVCEDCAEASDCGFRSAVATGYEEGGVGDVAARRSEQPRW